MLFFTESISFVFDDDAWGILTSGSIILGLGVLRCGFC